MTDSGLNKVLNRLEDLLARDSLVQKVTNNLRSYLNVDRVVLYYFYSQWQGQVTFEALSSPKYSILGSTGADECFNAEYAQMYQQGRVRAIANIETEQISDCHQDFLRQLKVKANLIVPILTSKGLWGLLIAYHCQDLRVWNDLDIKIMQENAQILANAGVIRTS